MSATTVTTATQNVYIFNNNSNDFESSFIFNIKVAYFPKSTQITIIYAIPHGESFRLKVFFDIYFINIFFIYYLDNRIANNELV